MVSRMALGKWGAGFQLGMQGCLLQPWAVLPAASLPAGAALGKTAPSLPLAPVRGGR